MRPEGRSSWRWQIYRWMVWQDGAKLRGRWRVMIVWIEKDDSRPQTVAKHLLTLHFGSVKRTPCRHFVCMHVEMWCWGKLPRRFALTSNFTILIQLVCMHVAQEKKQKSTWIYRAFCCNPALPLVCVQIHVQRYFLWQLQTVWSCTLRFSV